MRVVIIITTLERSAEAEVGILAYGGHGNYLYALWGNPARDAETHVYHCGT